MAVLPYLKFPTARSRLGNGKVEGGIILPVSVKLPGGFISTSNRKTRRPTPWMRRLLTHSPRTCSSISAATLD